MEGRLNRKKFVWNLAFFAVLVVLFQFAEKSRIGQELLDKGYDYLVRKNFVQAVLDGGEAEPLSPDLRLVIFDPRVYKGSYTKGLWTPREEVGLAVLNALRRGAKVVLLDFNFQGEAPVVRQDGRARDGNRKFLDYLGEAAELARAKGAVILAPYLQNAPSPGYQELLSRNGDVFRFADFYARRDEYDGQVRRLSWFTHNGRTPVLSAGLLAAILAGQEELPARAAAAQEAQGLLAGTIDEPRLLPPALARALKPENQAASSRLIFRYLPREAIRRKFGHGRGDLDKGFIWLPGQLAGPNLKEPDFSGKIVLIGSDYQENGDYQHTPFGRLAGSHILANGLNMILTGRMIEEAKGLNLALLVLTGLLASFLYARFTSLAATLFFWGVGLASPWLSAWTFNRYGFFVDVWLPALAVGYFNNIIASFVDWRAPTAKALKKVD